MNLNNPLIYGKGYLTLNSYVEVYFSLFAEADGATLNASRTAVNVEDTPEGKDFTVTLEVSNLYPTVLTARLTTASLIL